MGDLLSQVVEICPGMYVLPRFADSGTLLAPLQTVLAHSPLRQMQTSRGFLMSVLTSNCGKVGWISDRKGYRYVEADPVSGEPWHRMPEEFASLASDAAASAGFANFEPDACLINHYRPGTQMGAHQDQDESDFTQPIVSVSLGIDARFYVIGPSKRGKSTPVDLSDGDVMVIGGPARRYYHGVRKLKESTHSKFGAVRWNLTFRKAL
ncbi:MAG: alpha-ketoglutarate-dependent dioxygenase AlkB [Granulosicoccus sp.]